MQKENLDGMENSLEENKGQGATAETQIETSDGNQPEVILKEENPYSRTKFEELIKGPFKDAFAEKVQGIINKRFKEQKLAKAENQNTEKVKTDDFSQSEPTKNQKEPPSFDSLIEAGIDKDTAYSVLHLEELLEKAARQGAEIAAKNITEDLRIKASRPRESALGQSGYSMKSSVSSLTAAKRKELAQKAMLGEKIGF